MRERLQFCTVFAAQVLYNVYNNVYISLLGHTRLIARSRCLDDTDIIIIAIRAL